MLLTKIYTGNLKLINIFTKQAKRFLSIKETTCTIDGQTINYLKTGTGKHNIFCFPGALGTIWTDFRPQIEELDRKKFSIFAWDPPGYGKSRPPLRKFNIKFYHTDADMAVKLMDKLNIPKCSFLGWSDGGISSLILAAKYPERVDALVVWGANSYITEEDVKKYQKIRDINTWSEKMRQPMIEQYGEDYFRTLWEQWCDTMAELYKKKKGNICDDILSNIKCRTLVIHGGKDPLVGIEHPRNLCKKIKGALYHDYPKGKHNIHLRYADDFNATVTKFLLEEE